MKSDANSNPVGGADVGVASSNVGGVAVAAGLAEVKQNSVPAISQYSLYYVILYTIQYKDFRLANLLIQVQ